MRWAKHLTTARHDEKMALLLDALGPAGYGVYWLIVEIVGEKVIDFNTKVTYPEKFWRKNLGVSGQKLKVFLDFFAKSKLFSVEKCGNVITIDCPNILKYRDEWSVRKAPNSGVTRESLGRNSVSDTETDTETEKKKKTPLPPKGGERALPAERSSSAPRPADTSETLPRPRPAASESTKQSPAGDSDFEAFWAEYPKKRSKGQAVKTWEKLRKSGKLPDFAIIAASIQAQARSPGWTKDGGQFIPHPSTWLNAYGWLDDAAPNRPPSGPPVDPDDYDPVSAF